MAKTQLGGGEQVELQFQIDSRNVRLRFNSLKSDPATKKSSTIGSSTAGGTLNKLGGTEILDQEKAKSANQDKQR